MEERPIVFTVTQDTKMTRIYTKDGRVDDETTDLGFENDMLFEMMVYVSQKWNDKGYAVLFEVD